MRKRRVVSNNEDSLQELIKNSRFDSTANQDGFVGEGISPDKNKRRKKDKDDYETH